MEEKNSQNDQLSIDQNEELYQQAKNNGEVILSKNCLAGKVYVGKTISNPNFGKSLRKYGHLIKTKSVNIPNDN
ncbi:protein of unknown function [Oenococcus oeni]|uniref:hypothetical protein n=1 Tax=Oenococcus oeni TaxID=1247 RepID=UPI00107A14EF|nr:hypothetical protein [Oenococcus oeni]AVI94074.1 hypothetical protein AX764_04170 [Oenococcus oeni]SYV99734.1 hypothetical protein OENI_20117 [Oenococcus oeni]SYW03923.1 hypothetical protein OENI_90055 [Oenococcus oeni]SYW17688.1 hypothetical protein OENI_10356 [Oenococcus oeni]VDC14587.1 protein of unknown function [Oenococcus oeni]